MNPGQRMQRWFGFRVSKEQIATWDQEIKENFEGDYDKFVSGEYAGWAFDRDGRLAAVLLLDQFPRSMFRSTAKAFATDHQATQIAHDTVKDTETWQ
mmetsp:Transcript_5749/g.7759  ORF Transcript_5749/g.7759 Transcript_5749/m.7759 type:complete len:97 (+) Transcript_5749:106-396(+)